MNRYCLFGGPALAALFVVGCGPLSQPIPERLDPENQKAVDAAWNRALTPAGQHDRQTWLDVFVTRYAHEVGVDRLSFRSEKDLTNGKAVMEVLYDRTKPDDDRFVVTVYDAAGKVLRAERFTREDVQRTYRELNPAGEPGQNDPQRQLLLQRRQERVNQIFPEFQVRHVP